MLESTRCATSCRHAQLFEMMLATWDWEAIQNMEVMGGGLENAERASDVNVCAAATGATAVAVAVAASE